MNYAVVQCSQKASMKINKTRAQPDAPAYVNTSALVKYPIDQLEVGQAFAVKYEDSHEGSLRTIVYVRGKKDGKKFTIIRHNDIGVYEVARIG